jgi:hypothetical protein
MGRMDANTKRFVDIVVVPALLQRLTATPAGPKTA